MPATLIFIAVASILVISIVVRLANRALPFTVCPLCAGVFLTWVWLVAAYLLGYQVALIVPALLMGGSIVGSMYQLEKKFCRASAGTLLLWKLSFVSTGFIAAYALLERQWATLPLSVALLVAVSLVPLLSNRTTRSHDEEPSAVEKKMEDCC